MQRDGRLQPMPREHDPNRCRADERELLGPGAAPTKPRRKSDPAPPKAPTRLYSNDVKQSIFEAMHGWRMDGSPKGESPVTGSGDRFGQCEEQKKKKRFVPRPWVSSSTAQ